MAGGNAPRRPKHYTHRTFDDLVNEAGMCPSLGDTHEFVPKNQLEGYFYDVAEKHGVIDEMFSERFMDEDWD